MTIPNETDQAESTAMTVWPSVAGMQLLGLPMGQYLGQLYQNRSGYYIFTVGNFFCLLTIPLALVLYFKRIGPFVATRYRLTDRRIVVERGLSYRESKSIELDKFDSIELEVKPGYQWFDAADLVFRQGKTEVFRLEAVARAHAFREVCWKSHRAYMAVRHVLQPA